ncbi:MAG: Flp pilus assembly complex ATPase component TadA [Planctomycetes bacterium]|nr:Flp pilus assembly complex ATPase component TadA [Planctomycetota bacterium]
MGSTIEKDTLRHALRDSAPGRFSRMEGFGTRLPAPDQIASPLPISTIFTLLDAAALESDSKVLVAGMHSTFLVEVLARLVEVVHVVETTEAAAEGLRKHLRNESISNVRVRHAARLDAWDGHGPFHAILTDGSAHRSIPNLRTQIGFGGRLVTLARSGRSGRIDCEHRMPNGEIQTRRLGNVRTHSTLTELLESMRVLPDGAIDDQLASVDDPIELATHLRDAGLVDESDLIVATALHFGLGYASVDALVEDLDFELARSLPRKFLEHQGILPLKVIDNHAIVAITKPETDLADLAQAIQPRQVCPFLVSPTDYRRLWMAIALAESGPSKRDDKETEPDAQTPTSRADVVVLDNSAPTDQGGGGIEDQAWMLFESLMLESVTRRASDIHLEHGRSGPIVRLRIDGCLYPHDTVIDKPGMTRLVNVFKVQAGMDISERRLPQGGAMHIRIHHRHYDLRIQTQGTLSGENAVIRILPRQSTVQGIEDLGFSAECARRYRRVLENPSGIVLVVGPTGSGKSTTLYSGLRVLAADGTRKVVTIEDPVEHTVEGVQQSEVNTAAGLGFAEAVRSFLRLDPDVILIGEIRDSETAKQALRASRTGHLVLATMHCNETTDVIQRLTDLGQDASGLATELQGVLAQRLARRICSSCKVEAAPDPALVAELFPDERVPTITSYRGRGCSRCRGTGTSGRTAVLEFLPIDDALRDAISRGEPTADLRRVALQGDMVTLRERALELVRDGVVPLADLPRILSHHRLAPER